MLRVGLTGGFGAGKSTVAGWLREAGIPVLDADVIAHELLAPGGGGVEPVIAAFGESVQDAEGGVNRAVLGKIAFGDAGARKRLEGILHPKIVAASNLWLEEMDRRGHAAAAVEAALIFEAGTARRFDQVIAVVCPPEIRLARRKLIGDRAAAEAEARVAAQWPDEEKARRADWVVDNSGEPEATRAQVQALVERILAGGTPAAH